MSRRGYGHKPGAFLIGLFLLLTGCEAPTDSRAPAPRSPLAGVRLGAVLGGSDAGFARASQPRAFSFPADHGAHPEFRSEWWYLTCPLRDAGGAEFGVQFTLFRQALTPPETDAGIVQSASGSDSLWRTGQIYLAHAAITDVEQRLHTEASRLSRGHPAIAGVSSARLDEPFAVYLEDWRLQATNGSLAEMTLDVVFTDEQDASKGFEVHLALTPEQPVVLQGEAGLSRKAGDEASYYYSIPRLRAGGQLRATPAGLRRPVTGACWFDREWSTSLLAPGVAGWDWLALQFDDGSELMAFQLRPSAQVGAAHAGQPQPSAVARQAKRIDQQGRGQSVPVNRIEFVPTGYWRDETGIDWPTQWMLHLDGTTYRVRAALEDQRMRTSIAYWEGLVWVFDESDQRIGQGYLEMTGYDAARR